MNLAFPNPLLLWGLAAAALPLVVHLLFRRRPKPMTFPALDFVMKARHQVQRRMRLRKLLLFTARTLLLAAAALAIARPRAEQPGALPAAAAGPRATVVVLDASASMQYRLGGEPLFARARRDALEALTDLDPSEPASALLCDGRPPVAAPPGFDRPAARRVLEAALAGDGFADLTTCLAAAARALGEAKGQEGLGKRIVVVTDLTASAWRLEAPAPQVATPAGPVRPLVQVVDAARGGELPNVAVTDLTAEPDPAVGPRGYRITVTVANGGGGRARPTCRSSSGSGARRSRPCGPSSTCRPAPAPGRCSPTPSPPAGRSS